MEPVVSGSAALICGNLIGAVVDRAITIIGDSAKGYLPAGMGEKTTAGISSLLSIIFQVGAISLGTSLITNALPWLTEDPAAFTLYIMGLWSSSEQLQVNLRVIDATLLNETLYRTIQDRSLPAQANQTPAPVEAPMNHQ